MGLRGNTVTARLSPAMLQLTDTRGAMTLNTNFDQKLFRMSLGQFVTGVTIVSTISTDGQPIACTVNSFSSVSIDPPLVLFSLACRKNSVAHFGPGRPFSVSVLSAGQRHLSDHFAKSYEDKCEGLTFEYGHGGSPFIRDAVSIFEGIVSANHQGGDHVIVVGEVRHIRPGDTGASPLVFHRGQYASL